MKKILISGGTGFVGANFAHEFAGRGDEVHLIVRENSDLGRIEDIRDKVILHVADIADKDGIRSIFRDVRPRIVLHFAAHGASPAADRNDARGAIEVNLLGTINMADAFAEFKGECFINTGSSSEYGKKDYPMSEDDILAPESLYGITKAAATLYCSNLARQKDVPMATLRLFSPFGYFEGAGRLIPAIINAALSGKKFEAPSPDMVRDPLFIGEVIGAFDAAVKNIQKIKGEVINVASGEQYSVAGMVGLVKKITALNFEVVYGNLPLSKSEPKMWVADISKAYKLLGWMPSGSFEDGLWEYAKWLGYKN